jgi:hypothetical protein
MTGTAVGAQLRKLSCLVCCVTAVAGCGDAQRSTGARASATAPFVRIPAREARPRPRQVVLALAHLGVLRARCGRATRYLVSFTPNQSFSETVRVSAGDTSVKADDKRMFLSFAAPRRQVGREAVGQTARFQLVLDADHSPFDARAHATMRLADGQDGTNRCVAISLRVTSTTHYH